jgi:hypothetical protein
VSNANFNPQFINKELEVLFEDVMPGAIATATVTQNELSRKVNEL